MNGPLIDVPDELTPELRHMWEMAITAPGLTMQGSVLKFARLVAADCAAVVHEELLEQSTGAVDDIAYDLAIEHAVDAIKAKYALK